MRSSLVLFLVMVVLEVWSIIKVGHEIGALATLVLLVAGFVFGIQLMRSQGLSAMVQSARLAQSGESPMDAIAAGIVNAFAGILLILPGFVSDAIALVILIPFVRRTFIRHLLKKGNLMGFATNVGQGGFRMGGFGRPGANDDMRGGNIYEHDGPAKSSTDSGQVIEHKPDRK